MMSNRLHLPILSVVFLCAAITFGFAPGHMDADVLGMLRYIRTGLYTDWYPLLLTSLLKIALGLRLGPVAVLAFQVFSVGLSTYAIVAFFSRPLTAAIISYFVLLCPAVLGYLGALTSHGILTSFLLCGCAALLYLSRPANNKRHTALLLISFVALSLATMARDNAPLLTMPLFCMWSLALIKNRLLFRWSGLYRRVTIAATGCVLAIGTSLCGNALLLRLFHPAHTTPIEWFAFYDISAISLRANRLFLDREHFPAQSLNSLRKIFVKNDPNPLILPLGDPALPRLHMDANQTEVLRTWRGCVAMYPGYYITERWQLLRGLLGLDFRIPPAVPYHPFLIDKNDLGYHITNPAADAIVVEYLSEFQNTVVDRPFVYFILLLLTAPAIVLLPREYGDSRAVLLALGIGSFLYMASHFVAGPSTLLRYLWPCIVCNTVIGAAAAAYYVRLLRSRILTRNATRVSMAGLRVTNFH